MKKATGWSLLFVGSACLIFMFGVFVGRITIYSPLPKTSISSTEKHNSNLSHNKININTADAQQLQTIPGIGETLSERIIEYREKNGPFTSFQQLQDIEGLGNKTIVEIIEYICLEEE